MEEGWFNKKKHTAEFINGEKHGFPQKLDLDKRMSIKTDANHQRELLNEIDALARKENITDAEFEKASIKLVNGMFMNFSDGPQSFSIGFPYFTNLQVQYIEVGTKLYRVVENEAYKNRPCESLVKNPGRLNREKESVHYFAATPEGAKREVPQNKILLTYTVKKRVPVMTMLNVPLFASENRYDQRIKKHLIQFVNSAFSRSPDEAEVKRRIYLFTNALKDWYERDYVSQQENLADFVGYIYPSVKSEQSIVQPTLLENGQLHDQANLVMNSMSFKGIKYDTFDYLNDNVIITKI